MLNLDQDYNIDVESAYIITVKDNPVSESMFLRCARSCQDVGMPWKRWEAFDGTSGEIKTPEHLKNEKWIQWIKKANDGLSATEVALMLTSVSLWERCISINQPIVILEHDAFMVRKFLTHRAFNAIIYLGSIEQANKNFYSSLIPIMGQVNPNYRFILRTHAYSVDPIMARRLFSAVLTEGITTSVDVMIRSDIYTQLQMGIYAFDMHDNISIMHDKIERNKNEHLVRINNKIL